jgi:NAD dependent epimerase/dehydratase family.
MHTILGAGGVIGTELVKELAPSGKPIRLVARNPTATAGIAQVVAADVSDLHQTISAVNGSSVVYLLVGLKYDVNVWRELWPRVMRNAIEACKRANAKLIFFDNVYMYGKVTGPMTEETPFNPSSRKGEIRARIATMLLDEMKAGGVRALIARSADFYGPGAKTSVANVLVLDKLVKRQKASWLVNDSVPHSFTFTPDAAKSLAMLAASETSWNQTWHVPTALEPPTGKEFIRLAAATLGIEPRYRLLRPFMLKMAGWFNSDVRELGEMLYQYASPYLFDSSKFRKTFGFEPTAYAAGIERTISSDGSTR